MCEHYTTPPQNFVDTSKPYGAGTLAPHGDVVRLVDGGEDHGLVELSLVLEAAGVRALGGPGHAPLPARLGRLQQLRLQEAEVVVERVVLVEVGVPRVELLTINRRSCTNREKSFMIIKLGTQFHVYLPWSQCPFSIVS